MSGAAEKDRVFRRFRPAVALALACLSPSLAVADHDTRTQQIGALRAKVYSARGGDTITAMRELWAAWEHGEPAPVEAALDELAQSPKLTGEARAYAKLLRAHARRRRGDLSGFARDVRDLGYLTQFTLLGPFDNEGKGGFANLEGPELAQADLALTDSFQGKERTVRFRSLAPLQGTFEAGWIDLGSLLRPEENLCAFAVTSLRDARAAQKPRPLTLWLGQSGAVRVYWNGQEIARDERYRQHDADRLGVDVTLQPGDNQLVLKICGDEQAPVFSLRVAERDGAAAKELTVAQVEAVKPVRRDDKNTRAVWAQRGPLASFEAQVGERGERGGPAQWEAYARYLQLTSSDDPTQNFARDFAARAAERAPTMSRLLLAAKLAEDANQERQWIERAGKLPVANARALTPERRQYLLAKARLLRAGVNWRESVPLYDEVLTLDPDDDNAVLARVELYSEAGLPETAMAFLHSALIRNPRSVLLLRAATVLLQDQGRGLEAIEMMDRYASLRFDDPTFLRTNLERALARRDKDEAARLSQRLLQTAPDNPGMLGEVARAQVTIGDLASAIGYAKRASELVPEDPELLKQLADLYALAGRKNEQLALYRTIAELRPQDKTIRDYLAQQQPDKPRADEAYAQAPSVFLAKRGAPAAGQSKRKLLDLQVTTVFQNGLASRFHQVVTQPLTQASAAAARQYGFAYQTDSQTIELRAARIHKPDGSVVDAVHTGEVDIDNPEMAMYTSQRAFVVNFPRIDPGDVVEVRYRVDDIAHRNAFADYFGEVNYFESSEPVGRAEYVLITPKSRKLQFNKPRIKGLRSEVREQGNQRVFHFSADNLAAQGTEPLQPPGTELWGYVHASTYSSWDAMGKWYWGLVRDQFVADDEVKRRAAAITKGLSTTEEKVRAVYDYVVQNTRYVALEFGIHGYKPYRCAQIFARGFGDCKDKSTLIVTMLKELGIDATIVIVRTQLRGDFDSEPASLAPFDHAIAYVPSLDLYLDGTAEDTGAYELPVMDRGALALQVNQGKPKLVRLPDPPASESVTSRRFRADLSKELAQVEFSAEVNGVQASAWRRRYRNSSSRNERLREDLGSDLPGFSPKSVTVSDLTQLERNVQLQTQGTMSQLARQEGGLRSVQVGPREHLVREYAQLSSRQRDLRILGRQTQITEWSLKLPAQAKIIRSPNTAEVKSKFGWVKVGVAQDGPNITVRTEVAIDVSRVAVKDYPEFRKFCEQADLALGARLVYQVGGNP